MITYDWKITALKKAPTLDGLSDVITGINFKYTGTNEDGITDYFRGSMPYRSTCIRYLYSNN